MTRTSVYNRIVMSLVFIVLVLHIYDTHSKQNEILYAIAEHQAHAIEAFTAINNTIAEGILHRVQATKIKDDLQAEQRSKAVPTPTPKVITKTRTRIIRATPKPFKLFGPN